MEILTVNYQSAKAPELFCASLRETGFAILANHHIDFELVSRAYDLWGDFFNSDEKQLYLYQKPSQAGYFPFKSENAKDKKVSDLKEFYHFYPWATAPDHLYALSKQVYDMLFGLARELLQWIEMELPPEIAAKLEMPLNQMITDSPNTLLRIIHYPPIEGSIEEGAERAAAHEDINFLTLLPAATAPGLEVKDANQNWHSISCDPGNIVVNAADMLQLCTDHFYGSTTHRVVNPEGETRNAPRLSMPLFLHPRGDVKLSSEKTASEYLDERLKEIGIY